MAEPAAEVAEAEAASAATVATLAFSMANNTSLVESPTASPAPPGPR